MKRTAFVVVNVLLLFFHHGNIWRFREQAYWRVTSKRVVDNACMLLETSFLGQVVERLETQLLALTQDLTEEDKQTSEKAQNASPTNPGMGWQQPKLSMFNVSFMQGSLLPVGIIEESVFPNVSKYTIGIYTALLRAE